MISKQFKVGSIIFLALFLPFSIITKAKVREKIVGASLNAQGEPFMACKLPDLDGRTMDINQEAQKHKITLINIWASWCGPCRSEMPMLAEIYRTYKDRGLMLISVNVDQNPAERDAYLRDNPVPFPVLYDAQSTISNAYGFPGIPVTIVLDQQARIAQTVTGADMKMKEMAAKWLK